MTATMNELRMAIIFEIIRSVLSEFFGVLGEGVTRKCVSVAALLNLDTGGVTGRSRGVGAPQNSVLRENLVIQLGNKIILRVGVVPPDLPELDNFHCHAAKKTKYPKSGGQLSERFGPDATQRN